MSFSRLSPSHAFFALALVVLSPGFPFALAEQNAALMAARSIHVVDFLPQGYVTDGSVSYLEHLQAAVDAAGEQGGEVVFAPMTYRIDNPDGIRLRSGLMLRMTGAVFLLDGSCAVDGQAFLATDVTDVTLEGGKIIGRNDVWPAGVNIRGIHLKGPCKGVRIRDMEIRDLSSNGIGVFAADAEHASSDIWILDTIIQNCCNRYGDYQAPPPEKRGPETGSAREDQGLIALYHVHDFLVRGCRLEDSRSDGTHFYFCRRGQFTDNRVYRAKMGGYFLESCQHVLAANNVILDNGSRGVTIERGSQFCTLHGNTIAGSGREGLWIPDSLHCNVTANVFSLNGRKTNGDQLHTIWNANITINEAKGDTLGTPTAHYVIANNLIETDERQVAAIRIDTRCETADILIEGNLLTGSNRRIVVEGPNQDAVTAPANHGAEIERVSGE